MKTDYAPDQLLSRKQAAAFLGISPDTLATWKCRKKHSIPIVRVGSLAQYKLSDLRHFIEERVERCGQ